jgi:ATP-dependent phosphofructokinase / diphosphate-dependent phosphofructokinase
LAGHDAVMPIIQRDSNQPYRWSIGSVRLEDVANQEKQLPREYITADGFGITLACREYLSPLIQGEDYPPFHNGLPQYVTLQNKALPKRLTEIFSVDK